MAELTDAMLRHRRRDSEHKHALVVAALQAAVESGTHPTIAGIARAARVGRKFIYDHPDLRAAIELSALQATQHHSNGLVAAAGSRAPPSASTSRTLAPKTNASEPGFEHWSCPKPKANDSCSTGSSPTRSSPVSPIDS